MLVEGEIVIKRPIEEVFDFVADERNEPQYNPRMSVAEKVTDGPVGIGTKFHSVMSSRGGPAEMTIEFTQFDRPHRIVETIQVSNVMVIDGELRFEPVTEGTKMTWLWELHPRGVYKLLGPIIRRTGERQELTVWTGLKELLESPPAMNVEGNEDVS
jgi:uncharacterized protein YndB with AHSA1/START domain